jgi:hypothetical protein
VVRIEVRVEDVPHRANARLVEPESQLTDDLTLVGTLDDTGEQTIQMALREVVGEVSEGRAQIAAQVPRGRWVLRFVADLLDGFPDEVEASRPVRIDRGLGEAGPPGDLGVSNGIPADLDEQRGGGCDDVALEAIRQLVVARRFLSVTYLLAPHPRLGSVRFYRPARCGEFGWTAGGLGKCCRSWCRRSCEVGAGGRSGMSR